MPTKRKSKKPAAATIASTPANTAPADITGEALAEWIRITAAIESMGREIKPADRSLLALYCHTWVVNQQMYEHVKQYNAVIKWPNGVVGPSPQYKTFIETGKAMRGFLADLGCTPASRDFDAPKANGPAAPPAPLEF